MQSSRPTELRCLIAADTYSTYCSSHSDGSLQVESQEIN